MYGRKALLPCEDDREPETDLDDLSDTDYDCNFQRRADNMKGIFKTATKNIIKAQLKQQRDYKTRNAAKNAIYHINDKVLVWNNRRADRKGGKMLQPWVGPYTIVKIVNSNVELSSSIGKILHTKANISNLKCISQEISNSQENYNYLREECILFMRSEDFKLEMGKFIGYPVEEYLVNRNVMETVSEQQR
ncbi:unnamed protein product [Gordionus sp. m RMFG-2023]